VEPFRISYAKNERHVLDALLIIIFLTSSFDTLLNIKIAGFSLRICTLLMLLFSAFIIFSRIIVRSPVQIKFLGFWSFVIWFLFLVAFLPNSILFTRGLGYLFWLAIFFLFAIALAMYIRDLLHFQKILYLYLNSFTVIGIIAIIQWVFTLAGLDMQINYYFRSGIPRTHGFSYEPSYFSTYLFIPWVFQFMLYFTDYRELKNKIYNRQALAILTPVMFLSFSRMGILLIVLIAGVKALGIIRNVWVRSIIIRKEYRFINVILVGLLGAVFLALLNFKKFISVFEGLPIFSRYSHSASIRIDDFLNTWDIFIKSPIIGYSLGGIAPAIAKEKGFVNISQELVKNTEGMCIFLEVLAASGIIGFLFFLGYFIKFIRSAHILKRLQGITSAPDLVFWLSIHRLLVISWIFQLLLLCLNQNILRNYLWVHIAIINLSFFILKGSATKNEHTTNA
jgi:hypothetical protein